MDNPAPLNNRGETETAGSHKVSSMSFLEVFVTQTDWKSQQSVETWYGHHYPLRRAAVIFVLFSTSASVALIANTSPLISNATLINDLAQAQRECALSLCGAVQQARFSCIVDADGESASILPPYNGSYAIPFTRACIEAFKVTDEAVSAFSPEWNENNDDEDMGELDKLDRLMMRVFKEGQVNPPAAWLEIVPLNCSVSLLASDDTSENFALIDFFDDRQPNEIVQNVLESFVCPDAMKDEWREALSMLSTAHEIMLGPGVQAVVVLICLATPLLLSMMELMWTLPQLLLTAVLVRLCFRWPRDFRGRKTISFTSIYKTLLLLSVIYECRTGREAGIADLLVVSILALSSYTVYHNKEAAVEWVQLGVFWYTWSSVEPYLDSTAVFLRKFDGLGFFELIVYAAGRFVPGYGWWKLVLVYAFWRAFPRATRDTRHDKQD